MKIAQAKSLKPGDTVNIPKYGLSIVCTNNFKNGKWDFVTVQPATIGGRVKLKRDGGKRRVRVSDERDLRSL